MAKKTKKNPELKFLASKKVNGKKYDATQTLFTLASTGDNTPTVTLRRLFAGGFRPSVDSVGYGQMIEAKITTKDTYSHGRGKVYDLVFQVNRQSSGSVTARASSWPKGLRTPKVGRPVELVVLTANLLG